MLYEGKILDGRNRYQACKHAWVYPEFREYEGEDPVGFVVSLNLHRRHLSESQRAMAGAKIATLKQGTNRYEQKVDTAIAVSKIPSQTQVAKALNVSEDSLQRARKVQDSGAPELVAEVVKGNVAVSTAAKLAELPKEEQAEIVARVINVPSLLRAEHDANEFAKQWTVSERVAIAKAIEAEVRERARERQLSALKQNNDQATVPDNYPERYKSESRDEIAERAGFSSATTFERAQKVIDQGTPELVEAVDRGEVAVSTDSLRLETLPHRGGWRSFSPPLLDILPRSGIEESILHSYATSEAEDLLHLS